MVSALATALLLPISIRHTGLAVYAQWAVLSVFVGISSVLDLGVWKAVVFLSRKGTYPLGDLLVTATTVCVAMGFGFALFVALLVAAHVDVFGVLVGARQGLTVWICASGLIVVIASLCANIVRGSLEAFFKVHVSNMGYAALTLLQYGLVAVIPSFSDDPRWLVVGFASAYVAVLAGLAIYARRVGCLPVGRPSLRAAAALYAYGLRTFLADLPTIVLAPIVLYLFALQAESAANYGAFDLAMKIAMLAGTALSMLAAPFLALVASEGPGRFGNARALAYRFSRVTGALALAGCVVYALAGRYVIHWVFPEQPGPIFVASLTMLVGAAILGALEPLARVLMGTGQLLRLSLTRYLMLLVTLGLVAGSYKLAPLARYPAAVGIGYLVSAAALLVASLRANGSGRQPAE